MITRRNTVFAEEGKQLIFKGKEYDEIIITDDGSSTSTLVGMFSVKKGDVFRTKVSDGSGIATLTTATLTTSLGTIKQFSANLIVTKVSDL